LLPSEVFIFKAKISLLCPFVSAATCLDVLSTSPVPKNF
jgi:hypothetical protein